MGITNDDTWTKEELTVYTDGTRALIRAVVKQWIIDGKPRGDDMSPWFSMMKLYMTKEEKNRCSEQ